MSIGPTYGAPPGSPEARKIEAFPREEEGAIEAMDLIRVSGRRLQPTEDTGLLGFSLESPSPGWTGRTYNLPVRGWILAKEGPVEIEAVHEGRVLRRVKARFPRPDVQKRFGDVAHGAQSGFVTSIGVPGLPPRFEIALRAVLDGGKRIPLAILEGSHHPLGTPYEASLRPLIVTMMGRVGSSWLMRLLTQHPQVVVYPPREGDPYETRAASYWLHMLKVLLEPADHYQSTSRNDFTSDRSWIGHHPFHTPWMTSVAGINDWFGRSYVERLAEFCQRGIDGFYLQVARSTGKTRPLYFAEKFHADHIPWLAWELYPDAREIVLVRDFRDMVCSILAFNRKRGYHAFGREMVGSDVDYVKKMKVNVAGFISNWRLRSNRTLLLRYEDLVRDPEPTLRRLLEYLGVETDVTSVLSNARNGAGELSNHRTIEDAAASIGRWKTELEPALQEACAEAFQEALVALGYE